MMSQSSTGIRLIVGLGNPGRQYAATRHNVGFWFLMRVAERYHIQMNLEPKFHALTGRGQIAGKDVRLLMPQTFMNLSANAVAPFCRFYQICNSHMLVAHDELDFDIAKMRLKFAGGHGGHNGLRSIGTQLGLDFYRLRLGIGHPKQKSLVTGYVLGQPSTEEKISIDLMLEHALTALPDMIDGQFNQAQQSINSFQLP